MRHFLLVTLLILIGCDERIGCLSSSSPKIVESSQSINLGVFKFFVQFENVGNSINFAETKFDETYFESVSTTWNPNTVLIQGNSIKSGKTEMEIFVSTNSDEYCEEEGIDYLDLTIN